MRRVWFYRQWDGKRPILSSDEYGRRTLLLTLPGLGAVVFALWRFRCDFCELSREQTREDEREASQ